MAFEGAESMHHELVILFTTHFSANELDYASLIAECAFVERIFK